MAEGKQANLDFNNQGTFTYNQPTYPTYPQGNQTGFVNSGFQSDDNQKSGTMPQPMYPRTTFVSQPPQHIMNNRNDSYCERLYTHRRQTGSIIGGLLLMIVSGLHIGWGIWRIFFVAGFSASVDLLTFMIITWSLGGFIGAFFGAFLTPILRKNIIYCVTASIMLIGNLLLIIWDGETAAIIVGRIILGAAHGAVFVTLITHAGENAAHNMRGTVVSTLNASLYAGIFVSVVLSGTVRFIWQNPVTLSAERIIGILGALISALSIICSLIATVETIPFLLYRNDRVNAMTNLKFLRDAPFETSELKQELDEFDVMIAQDKQNSGNIFTNGNGKPLLLMTMMRLMVALTNNVLINVIAITFSTQLLSVFNIRLVPLIVVAPRLGMALIQIFYADVFKRKLQIFLSAASAATVIILFGILLNTLTAFTFRDLYVHGILFAVLWLIFQFSCGIGMDQMQDVYLSEAFSTAKKPWSIAFVTAFEHLFHIFMIGMYRVDITTSVQLNALIFCTGIVVLLIAVILVFTLPETRRVSLRSARDLFANRSNHFIMSPFA
ncbi:H(+)/hexose cotransporter 1 [Pseudolycoriella hygida]|uniref:H(+)/hexose cotransporter 1 n=1 Tax=Pseudolycoriella hygida TaxID=35572 RepID=A0A9Q0S8Z0_9DIPT|nr:H(+)/hexose cotransporter 1 [Pseudolycoriella hygida]